MPFKSKSQQKWMFSQKPEMAKRWAKETPNIKNLPAKVKIKMKTKKVSAPGEMFNKFKKKSGLRSPAAVVKSEQNASKNPKMQSANTVVNREQKSSHSAKKMKKGKKK